MDPLQSGQIIQHYRVIGTIGQGGMGAIYRAEDLKLGRQVAIKLLAPSVSKSGTQARERLLREARAASLLNHPNIVTIYSIEQENDSDFIVMEYLEGETLRSLMLSGPLDPDVVIDIGAQAADALAAAHSMGVVHRDIKPDNILITSRGQVKVLDFGLAKLISPDDLNVPTNENLTESGIIIGTVAYMSPEQTRGEPLDGRTDVFSLGSVLYEAATGKSPFRGSSLLLTMHEIAAVIPPRPSVHRSEIPAMLDHWIDRALAKDRDQRCAAAELADGLNQLRSATSSSHSGAHIAVAGFRPHTRYTRSGDVNIAYQVIGNGPHDLVFVMGWVSHLEYFWEEPSFARFLKKLAAFSRLILFDKRGTGLSDRLAQLPTLEQRMDDVRAVMDAVGSQKAMLCGVSEGGPMCSLFAATYPERTLGLILIGTYAKRIWDQDYPWAPTAEQRETFFQEIEEKWGGPVGISERAPSAAHDPRFREWWATYLRMGASPGAAVALTRMNAEIDVRSILPSIRVPVLILHRKGDRCIKIEESRYIAERIPGCALVELPGDDHLPFVGDQKEMLEQIEDFVSSLEHLPEPDRVLVTLLHASIDPSNSKSVLDQYTSSIRKELAKYRGKEVRSTSDDYLASFDGPARAIRSACRLSTLARQQNIDIRIGLHTGECDILGDRFSGVALSVARHIASLADPGEVLVSSTVKDLVAGAGITFEDRGLREEFPHSIERRLYSARV